MTISQSIYDYIELAKLTKIPLLLISNPGYGKTTTIQKWAKEKDYNYEQLIGSRFSPDDIMGYQVNEVGSDTLIQKDPIWFKRIMDAKNNGKSTVLFIDELSTCSDAVQGSLLSLIFDRRIGNGKELPEDTIIISAANYSENLPSFMNIMAPTLNRFCIINLMKGFDNFSIVSETLNIPNVVSKIPQEVNATEIINQFNQLMVDVFSKYSQVDSSIGYIDLQNHDIADIYKRSGNVYNIISWRSVSYLREFVIALSSLGICEEHIVKNVVGGLIGLGSNSFKNEEQIENFINLVATHIIKIIESSYTGDTSYTLDATKKISDLINEYINDTESITSLNKSRIESQLIEIISNKYGNYIDVFNNLENELIEPMGFVSDMDAMAILIPTLGSENAAIVSNVHQSCLSMYDDILGTDTIFSKDVYGINTPSLIKKVLIARDHNKGNVGRVGVYGNNNDGFIFIPNSVTVAKATASRQTRREFFEELHLKKVLK